MRCSSRRLLLLTLSAALFAAGGGGCTWIVDLTPRPDPDGSTNSNHPADSTVPPDGDASTTTGCVTMHEELQINSAVVDGDQDTIRGVAGASGAFLTWVDRSGTPGSTGLSNVLTVELAFDPAAPFPAGQIESTRYTGAGGDEDFPAIYTGGLYFVDTAGDSDVFRADLDGASTAWSGVGTEAGVQDQLIGAPTDDPNEPVVWRHVVSGTDSDIYLACGAQQEEVTSGQTGLQDEPGVQSTGAGDGIVVWSDRSATHAAVRYRPFFDCAFTSQSDLLSSRQNDAGQPAGQSKPAVGGGFSTSVGSAPYLVVWEDASQLGPDFFPSGLRGHPISSTGIPTGSEIQINTTIEGAQREPRVGQILYTRMSATENAFLVVWQSAGSHDDGADIRGIFLDAAGAPISTEDFLINTATAGDQTRPLLLVSPDHRSVFVAWEDHGGNGTDSFGAALRGRMITFGSTGCN